MWCAVLCRVEGGSSPFLGSSSFILVVCFSFLVSRFRWDCTAGCSEHSREAPNTFGFGIAAGCSEHSRELPTLSGLVAVGCLEHSQAPNAFGFGRRRLVGPSARWRRMTAAQFMSAISLTLDSWQDHVAPLVSRVQTVPALRRLVQPAENKSHSVGCRWRGSLLWNGSLLWERYLVAEE